LPKLSITAERGCRWHRWSDGRMTPERFRADWSGDRGGVSWSCQMSMTGPGQWMRGSTTVHPPRPDAPVRSSEMGQPWSRFERAAVEAATVDLRRSGRGGLELLTLVGAREDRPTPPSFRVPRSGSVRSEDQLLTIAGAWRAAKAAGVDPVDYLMRESSVSRATAYRWISEARREGLIPAGRGSRSRA